MSNQLSAPEIQSIRDALARGLIGFQIVDLPAPPAGSAVTHRDIARLRDRARFAREYQEKALVAPDELDTLLDYALAQIEDEK